MSVDWTRAAAEYWQAQPHPAEPSLTIGEFPIAVQLATKVRFGGHASPQEAALFWREFKQLGMAPQAFEHLVDQMAPVSFAFQGRPPSMQELAQFRDAAPHEVAKHYADLPDRHHPDVSAGAMVKALAAADPHARQHLARRPTKTEGRYLIHSGEKPGEYYQRLKADSDAKTGGDVHDKLRGVQNALHPPGG